MLMLVIGEEEEVKEYEDKDEEGDIVHNPELGRTRRSRQVSIIKKREEEGMIKRMKKKRNINHRTKRKKKTIHEFTYNQSTKTKTNINHRMKGEGS